MRKTSGLRRMRTEAERQAVMNLVTHAFAASPADVPKWLDRAGPENVRIYPVGKEVAGCLWLIPCGQWFGGKSVPMDGIAAVAVHPQHRARGIGSQMMAACVRELHAEGFALSALYPASVPLYRRAGYEVAGEVHEISVPLGAIAERDRELTMRPLTAEDAAVVRRVYQHRAERTNGNLDRNDYLWRYRWDPFGPEPMLGYGVWNGDELEGYLFYIQKRGETALYSLQINDLVFTTPPAGRRLLTFLADHRTMGERAIWRGTPADPLMLLMFEHRYASRLLLAWMLRIVDVPRALEARGYPAALKERIDFEIADDIVPENAGRFVLEIEAGQARVRRGGRGAVRLTARALAPLYSGRVSPLGLVTAGQLEAGAPWIDRLGPIFAGPAPWMADMF